MHGENLKLKYNL